MEGGVGVGNMCVGGGGGGSRKEDSKQDHISTVDQVPDFHS